MKRRLLISFICISLCFPVEVLADKVSARPGCEICGMYIDQYQRTAAHLTLKNGETKDTCGVACMLRMVNDKGGPDAFLKIEVRDWNSKRNIPAADAHYVIGSKLIPDMMPSLIAFEKMEDAEAFRLKEGGAILNFTQGLMSISPMGMTMPARIKTAVLPPQGALNVGVGYMYMSMDKVQLGSDSIDPEDFIKRPGQLSAPKKMTSRATMLMGNYAITDKLSLGINAAYFDKKMESYKMGGKVIETTTNSGYGDIDATFRYSLWNDVYYSKFLTVVAGSTLPTGEFESKYITMPGLQIGTGDFSFTGGLLFSHRFKDLWFHYQGTYTAMLENSDDYKFGDITRIGAALHYTPTYDFMVGLEVDGAWYAKDEYRNDELNNTGGFRSYLTGVVDWKFFTALGGTFSVRATGGIPIYEDINHERVGSMEKTKMGGGYFASAMVSFNRRFPFD